MAWMDWAAWGSPATNGRTNLPGHWYSQRHLDVRKYLWFLYCFRSPLRQKEFNRWGQFIEFWTNLWLDPASAQPVLILLLIHNSPATLPGRSWLPGPKGSDGMCLTGVEVLIEDQKSAVTFLLLGMWEDQLWLKDLPSLLILPRQACLQWAGGKIPSLFHYICICTERSGKSSPFPLFQCVGFNTRPKRFQAVLRDVFSSSFAALSVPVSLFWCGRQGGQLGSGSLWNPERSGDQLTLEKSSLLNLREKMLKCVLGSASKDKNEARKEQGERGTTGTRKIGIKSSMQNCH